jgi:hypothetical protein
MTPHAMAKSMQSRIAVLVLESSVIDIDVWASHTGLGKLGALYIFAAVFMH